MCKSRLKKKIKLVVQCNITLPSGLCIISFAIYPNGPSIKACNILFLYSSIRCGWKCVKYFSSICFLYNMTSDTFPLVLCPSQFPDWIDCIHSLRLSTPYCGQYFFYTGKQYYSIQSIINMCQQILSTSYMIFELLSSYDRLDFNNILWFKRKLQRNIKKYTFLYFILKFDTI